jgi:DnaJ family protein C protein 9
VAVECIGRVFNQMMCSDPQVDSHRFMDIIDSALSSGEFSLC